MWGMLLWLVRSDHGAPAGGEALIAIQHLHAAASPSPARPPNAGCGPFLHVYELASGQRLGCHRVLQGGTGLHGVSVDARGPQRPHAEGTAAAAGLDASLSCLVVLWGELHVQVGALGLLLCTHGRCCTAGCISC